MLLTVAGFHDEVRIPLQKQTDHAQVALQNGDVDWSKIRELSMVLGVDGIG